MKILETDRLILRTWNDDDLQPMLAINQDPKVMEYFPELQDLETTKKLISRINSAKSIRVMQKIGLQHNEAYDFDHPKLDDESPLKRHVLYRLSRNDYLNNAANITSPWHHAIARSARRRMAEVSIHQYKALQTGWEMCNSIPLDLGILHCSKTKICPKI